MATTASCKDIWGTIGTRIGLTRRKYIIAPGLYSVGTPGPQAPVLVTANYKLTFDALRCCLGGIDAWLLVIDTRGINVWCAAGKGTLGTDEVVASIHRFRLHEVVSHRQLILPQLAATGVSALNVRQRSGFSVMFGPVRAADLPAFLRQDNQADETMRAVTFTLAERAVLIPVEFFLLAKPLLATILLALLLSGIGPEVFSPAAALERGVVLVVATGLGILSGAALTPLLLPWLPGRQFWLKGIVAGLPAAVVGWQLFSPRLAILEEAALVLWVGTVSSYLAMHFTGSTPFTSPSGVEYEMRRGLPVQIGAAALAVALWLTAPFT